MFVRKCVKYLIVICKIYGEIIHTTSGKSQNFYKSFQGRIEAFFNSFLSFLQELLSSAFKGFKKQQKILQNSVNLPNINVKNIYFLHKSSLHR